MKYQFSGQSIPQESRQELNNKILYLIDNDLAESSGITAEDIFNAYTGDGGLHGLKFQDYDSYAEFSSAKKEIENGQFFTPDSVCQFIMECLAISTQDVVADLTCGMGGFLTIALSKPMYMVVSWMPKHIRWPIIYILKQILSAGIFAPMTLGSRWIILWVIRRLICGGGWMEHRFFPSFTTARKRQNY